MLLVIFTYFVCCNRRKSSSTNTHQDKDRYNSTDVIYDTAENDDHVNNYEDVENEQPTYTALKWPGGK